MTDYGTCASCLWLTVSESSFVVARVMSGDKTEVLRLCPICEAAWHSDERISQAVYESVLMHSNACGRA